MSFDGFRFFRGGSAQRGIPRRRPGTGSLGGVVCGAVSLSPDWSAKAGSSWSLTFRTSFVRETRLDLLLLFPAATLSSRARKLGKPGRSYGPHVTRVYERVHFSPRASSLVRDVRFWKSGVARRASPRNVQDSGVIQTQGSTTDNGEWTRSGVWGPLMALDDARDHLVLFFPFHPSAPVRDQLARNPVITRLSPRDFV